MIRRRDRGEGTVEVVVDDPDGDDALPAPRASRLRHPWRWATALLVVGALALATTSWQRVGREVEVADAGMSWGSDGMLTCDGGATTSIHIVTQESSEVDTVARVGEDPADIVTIANRGARTVTLRLADPTAGAFEPGVDGPDVLPGTPTAERVRTTERVTVPAGGSARLRLVAPRVDSTDTGTALVWVTSIPLKVTSLGVTTTQDVALETRIVGISVGAAAAAVNPGTGTPWSFGDDLCGPSS
ncbi:MAG TPA: hypothetical protein VNR17_05545 [Luteimicrobium sp.]|nr:hypothetical protein [Luteimicrobium sp.]